MTGGRGRDGIQRRGWLDRRHDRRSPPQPIEIADVAGPDHTTDAGGPPDEGDPPASLDQVLRRAAEARDAERDPDD